jgi:hypothetical protein
MDGMNGGPLTTAQEEALTLMKEHFKDLGDASDVMFPLDTSCLMRYLVARQFDFKKAKTMLSNTLQWRAEFGVKNIHTNEYMNVIKKENSTGKIYLRNYDNAGHVIMYMRPKFENTNDHDGNLKHLVYNLERAISCMKKRYNDEIMIEKEKGDDHDMTTTDSGGIKDGVISPIKLQEKITLLVDYDGYSLFNAPPIKTSRATLDILQNHYPERLYKAYCIRPPWIFSGFWKLISPFIDIKTKTKIVMITGISTVNDIAAQLENDSNGILTATHIESDLGGLCDINDNIIYSPNIGDVNIDNKNGKGEFMQGHHKFSCARYLGYLKNLVEDDKISKSNGNNVNSSNNEDDNAIDKRARDAFDYAYDMFQ